MSEIKLRIYHSPLCSKSREALALLRGRDLEPEVVLYLEGGLKASELRDLVMRCGLEPHSLVRTKEEAYARAKLHPESSLDEVVAAILQAPVLLERPIVVLLEQGCGSTGAEVAFAQAAIGRPLENVLALLSAPTK